MDYKRDFIRFMVGAGALRFGEFTLKSGRVAPYFINTGAYQTGSDITRLGSFYASYIVEHMETGELPRDIAALFGPAYKGIPLAVAAAGALYREHGLDVSYCFNRKEFKDHGERGILTGYQPKDGDKLLIIEDVITAGTAVREVMPILTAAADVRVPGLIISVDRMERGSANSTATAEIYGEFGIKTFSIVTVEDILDKLHGVEIGGKVILDDAMRARMEEYMAAYCQRA